MNDEMVKSKKGFTLAELLIVVAIIAVLVAISIPIFTNQLEKAREAVDMENIRSAYSTMKYAEALEEGPDGKRFLYLTIYIFTIYEMTVLSRKLLLDQ